MSLLYSMNKAAMVIIRNVLVFLLRVNCITSVDVFANGLCGNRPTTYKG